MDPIPGVVVLKKDFLDDDAPDAIRAALGGHRPTSSSPTWRRRPPAIARPIISAPSSSARPRRISPSTVLKPGGHFVTKVFQGGTEGDLLATLKRDFTSRPPRQAAGEPAESVELYLVAKGFRGAPA